MHRPRSVRHAVLRSHLLLLRRSRITICFSSQCINRQSTFPLVSCESTCFLQLHVVFPFSFCVIPRLSYVFSISPASYVFLSRFSLPCPLLLSLIPPHLDRFLAVPSPSLPQCSPKPSVLGGFFSLHYQRPTLPHFLFYLILRLIPDPLLLLTILQRSAVFSLTPSTSRQ